MFEIWRLVVNTVIKHPPASFDFSQISGPADWTIDEFEVRPDITLVGRDDVRERIACALSARTRSVTVERYRYSFSKLAACCSGKWEGKRLFAKILLADPYPVRPRFRAPWESASCAAVPVRAIAEQIDTEWNMALKMRTLSGGRSVPVPLGRSLAARTIVWEEAGGRCLIRALKWSRWRSSLARAGAKALFQAGTWLRSVHEASHQGMEVIEARHLIQTASGLSRQKQVAGGHYEKMVSRILEASLVDIGEAGEFSVPVALTHGDFCLSNLIWDTTERRLAVIDFELSAFRPAYFDLFALIADLRSALLNPLIPRSVIQVWEQSFLRGYGPIPARVIAFVKALALARLFYHHFPRLQTRRERRGWIGGVNAQLYRAFLERKVITQRLGLSLDFAPSDHD